MRNALINRYRFSSMRPRQFFVHVAVYSIAVVLLLLINGSMLTRGDPYGSFKDMARSLYFQFLCLQALILWFWASHNTSSAIRDEVVDRSYDFFRMLPLSAASKTVGILVGKNLAALLFAGINLALLILSGVLGAVSPVLQAQVALLLVSNTLLFNSTALLASLCVKHRDRRRSSSVLLLILLALFVVPQLFNGIYFLSRGHFAEEMRIDFFGASLAGIPLISAVTFYFSAWALTGVIRRFTYERESLFTTRGVILFCIGYQGLLLGFFWAHLPKAQDPLLAFCWFLGFLPLFILIAGAGRNFCTYVESCGRAMAGGRSGLKSLVGQSNLMRGMILYAIWAGFALVSAGLRPESSIAEVVGFLWVILTAYAFLLLLMELSVLYSPDIPKLKTLLVVVAGLFIVLPPIFGAIFGEETLMMHSPLVYFFAWQERSLSGIAVHRIWIVNLLLCAWPARVVVRKYRAILDLRRQMQSGS